MALGATQAGATGIDGPWCQNAGGVNLCMEANGAIDAFAYIPGQGKVTITVPEGQTYGSSIGTNTTETAVGPFGSNPNGTYTAKAYKDEKGAWTLLQTYSIQDSPL